MTFSMRRLSAILRKEMQDLKSNAQIFLMAAVPIILSLFYKNAGAETVFLSVIVIAMVWCMVTPIIQATLIAEEKEKHTLRVVMLSPASPLEVMLGKALPTIVLSYLLSIGSLWILGTLQGDPVLLSSVILLGIVFATIIGTMIGLLAKNMVQVSVIGTPFSLLLLAGPILKHTVDNEFVKDVLSYLPTDHFGLALFSVLEGKGFSAIDMNLLNISIWMIITFIICLVIYKKKQLD
ncbi:ABC transporter permease [Bacillus manliponensis]|uniref:ABC transporter permease n=1 Tax=Bacillus manliponensis TaxID=574376 RepID=UPI003519B267